MAPWACPLWCHGHSESSAHRAGLFPPCRNPCTQIRTPAPVPKEAPQRPDQLPEQGPEPGGPRRRSRARGGRRLGRQPSSTTSSSEQGDDPPALTGLGCGRSSATPSSLSSDTGPVLCPLRQRTPTADTESRGSLREGRPRKGGRGQQWSNGCCLLCGKQEMEILSVCRTARKPRVPRGGDLWEAPCFPRTPSFHNKGH